VGKVKQNKSAQDEYFNLKLMEKKLTHAVDEGVITQTQALAYSKSLISGVEEWKLKILMKLAPFANESAEMLQYYSLLNCSTKEEVAEKLAVKAYNKQRLSLLMDTLVDPEEVTGTVKKRLTDSAQRLATYRLERVVHPCPRLPVF
jgi:hypothetical protein